VVGRYRGSVSRTEQAVVVGAGVSGLTTAACLAEAGWADACQLVEIRDQFVIRVP